MTVLTPSDPVSAYDLVLAMAEIRADVTYVRYAADLPILYPRAKAPLRRLQGGPPGRSGRPASCSSGPDISCIAASRRQRHCRLSGSRRPWSKPTRCRWTRHLCWNSLAGPGRRSWPSRIATSAVSAARSPRPPPRSASGAACGVLAVRNIPKSGRTADDVGHLGVRGRVLIVEEAAGKDLEVAHL